MSRAVKVAQGIAKGWTPERIVGEYGVPITYVRAVIAVLDSAAPRRPRPSELTRRRRADLFYKAASRRATDRRGVFRTVAASLNDPPDAGRNP